MNILYNFFYSMSETNLKGNRNIAILLLSQLLFVLLLNQIDTATISPEGQIAMMFFPIYLVLVGIMPLIKILDGELLSLHTFYYRLRNMIVLATYSILGYFLIKNHIENSVLFLLNGYIAISLVLYCFMAFALFISLVITGIIAVNDCLTTLNSKS